MLGKSWRCALPWKSGFHRERSDADGRAPADARSPGSGRAASVAAASSPLAIIAKTGSALRLAALDEVAEKLGLALGQSLADARAMIPALAVTDDDPAADARLLAAIADWAERYTPLVALDGAAGLMLDITGCAHLFGGEAVLVADCRARLAAQGFAVRAAVADTPGAAFAAARFTDIPVVPPDGAGAMLEPLPLTALRLSAATVAALDRVGLKRVGQLADRPRGPLVARFGVDLIRRLDQALGRAEEAIAPRRPPPAFIAERRFAEPIAREEDIAASLSSLAATLAGSLERHGEGARFLEFALFRVDGAVIRIGVGAARPIRAPKLILGLFREKFASLGDDLDVGFGFDMARLSVMATVPADPVQADFTGNAAAEADLGGLIDRIGARLGPQSIATITARESYLPERSEMLGPYVPRDRRGLAEAPAGRSGRTLPLRLFANPEPVNVTAEVPEGPPLGFRWRRAHYSVVRAEGPERVAAEWWREDDAPTRDYFRVEDSDGHRFWLFREGLYGRETSRPRWYVHGMFA